MCSIVCWRLLIDDESSNDLVSGTTKLQAVRLMASAGWIYLGIVATGAASHIRLERWLVVGSASRWSLAYRVVRWTR
jgi:hypothetical protein